ncbi:MAG: EF-hand domain-containing protein [Acidobacteria bacterium]|nr:EF-hand domain-containing protein [Acidobacteriota bacterium]
MINGGEVREGLARRHRREDAEHRFQKIDRDGDGRLSRDEFRGSEERFRTLDRNNDGFLTPDELKSRGRNQ